MKKKIFAVGSALVLGAVILPAGTMAWAAGITDTKAKEIALKNAGIPADKVVYSSVELDYENGRQVYEVEFYTKDFMEYDYEIDPTNGNVLSVDYDAEDYQIIRGQDGSVSASVSLEKAKKTALKHAGLSASDVTFVKAKQDWDDGRLIYDIEFITDDYEEYDYEIDAVSGDILSWDYDAEDYSPSKKPQNGEDYITLDEAKRAALKKAGLKSSEVTFLKAKQDFDDGSMKYELKFYSGSMEYEAEVDALTGKILDWESEQAEGSYRRRDHRADHHDDDWDDDYDDDHDFDDDYDD